MKNNPYISYMSKLTISEAAKIYNLTRGAIYDRINAGTLSTSLNERGNKVVDMADLVAALPAECANHVTVTDR